LQLEPDLVYPEHPVKIVDHKTRVTRNHTSNFYKVQWNNHSEREATWETEEFVRTKCPELLQAYRGTHQFLTFHLAPSLNLGTRFLLGGRIVTPRYLSSVIKLIKVISFKLTWQSTKPKLLLSAWAGPV